MTTTTTPLFRLAPASAGDRNLAWMLSQTWSDCITFDDTDKNTFRYLVAGLGVEPTLVVRFLHHALAKAATRKGQSMARRQIIAPLQDIAELVEPLLAPSINTTGLVSDMGSFEVTPTMTWSVDAASQTLADVEGLRARQAFIAGMLMPSQQQRLADFDAGFAAAVKAAS